MNAAKPLFYLTFRTTLNAIKRALTTPRRLISLLLFMGYYFMFFMRPGFNGGGRAIPPRAEGVLQFPTYEVIDGVAFCVFALLSIMMLAGIASANANFKPADVDVLFSTPISPRVVLMFRMARDYLVTLIVPLLIALFGIRPVRMGWEAIFRGIQDPQAPALALRYASISWILMAMGWITLTYGISLRINRSDRDSTKTRRQIGWGISVALIALIAFIAWQGSQRGDLAGLLEISRSPLLRVPLFMATFATEFTISPLSNHPLASGAMGLTGLIGVILIGLVMAFRQVGWMYDQAAVRAVQYVATQKNRGDVAQLLAHQAREGKYRGLRFKFIQNIRMRGPWALVWREMILVPRVMLGLTVLFTLIALTINILPILMPKDRDMGPGYMILLMQAITVFMVAMGQAQVGFLEVLRRVDLQKPLPFKPSTTAWFEILAKGMTPLLPCILSNAVIVIVRPELWTFSLAALVFAPAAGTLITSCVFFVTMLFPDVEDPMQRQFWALMTMLVVVIVGAFPAGVLVVLLAVKTQVVIASILASLVASALAFLVATVSGALYANFNPGE
ncbi:MAG: putative ABC exporter domain-containing protein [Fimbriimonadaceae bacterium]